MSPTKPRADAGASAVSGGILGYMRRTIAVIVAMLALAGCSSGPTPSSHTEWLAATTGERDAVKLQGLLDEIHEHLQMGTGPAVDKESVLLIADLRTSTVAPLLSCMAKVAEREDATGPAAFVDIAVRCDADWQIAYE